MNKTEVLREMFSAMIKGVFLPVGFKCEEKTTLTPGVHLDSLYVELTSPDGKFSICFSQGYCSGEPCGMILSHKSPYQKDGSSENITEAQNQPIEVLFSLVSNLRTKYIGRHTDANRLATEGLEESCSMQTMRFGDFLTTSDLMNCRSRVVDSYDDHFCNYHFFVGKDCKTVVFDGIFDAGLGVQHHIEGLAEALIMKKVAQKDTRFCIIERFPSHIELHEAKGAGFGYTTEWSTLKTFPHEHLSRDTQK